MSNVIKYRVMEHAGRFYPQALFDIMVMSPTGPMVNPCWLYFDEHGSAMLNEATDRRKWYTSLPPALRFIEKVKKGVIYHDIPEKGGVK